MSTQDVPTVFIVDDDRDVRESLEELLESVGLHSKSFGTAQEFLSSPRSDGPSCLILDVRLPGISGLDLQHVLDAVQRSLTRDRIVREKQRDTAELRQRYNTLSVREREVMTLVVSGMLNKQIAAELGASEATVKMHRGQAMKKMQAKSLPELVRMEDKLKSIT